MAEPNTVSGAAHRVIVLAFDLVDSQILEFPAELKKALLSPQVRDSITTTLLHFAQSKMGPQTAPVSNADGQKLLTDLGKGISDGISKDLLEQIKRTPEYKRLAGEFKEFEEAAKSSSLGVWVDENKKILYVVGAALVVGGATVLYVTKTGGPLVNTAVDPLKGKEVEFLRVGTLKIAAGLWDFKPDARILGGRVSVAKKWEKVSVDLKFGLLAKGSQVQQWDGSATVKTGPLTLATTGGGMPQLGQVNFGVRLGYEGAIENGKFNIGLGAIYKADSIAGTDSLSGTLSAGYTTKQKATFGFEGTVGPNQTGQVEEKGMLTLTVPW